VPGAVAEDQLSPEKLASELKNFGGDRCLRLTLRLKLQRKLGCSRSAAKTEKRPIGRFF
jgi:hypothetical protein